MALSHNIWTGLPVIDNCNFGLDVCVCLFLGMIDCSYKNIMLEWLKITQMPIKSVARLRQLDTFLWLGH